MLRVAIRFLIVAAVVCFTIAGEAATSGKSLVDAMTFHDAVEIGIGTWCLTLITPLRKRLEEVERKVVILLHHIAPRTDDKA